MQDGLQFIARRDELVTVQEHDRKVEVQVRALGGEFNRATLFGDGDGSLVISLGTFRAEEFDVISKDDADSAVASSCDEARGVCALAILRRGLSVRQT